MNRKDILTTAIGITTNDRQNTHGKPEDTFGLIARLWGDYLGIPVNTYDVATLLVLLKTARLKHNAHHMDNWVDIAGYAACGGELAGEKHE